MINLVKKGKYNIMREFLKTNTITHNLMSFSGFKSIFIFTLLADGPKTYAQIQEAFRNNEYLHENISIDSLRIYMNSLKKVGCDIKSKCIGKKRYFLLNSHPFELKVDDNQVTSIIKIYKTIVKSIEICDLISLHNFFDKISKFITNTDLKEQLDGISPLNGIDIKLIEELRYYTLHNAEIVILYKSDTSRTTKEITIIVDKMATQNGKLYIYGINSEYKNYSSFLVSKVTKVISSNFGEKTLELPDIKLVYEYYKDYDEDFELQKNEEIIEETEDKYIVEFISKSKFEIMQRVFYHGFRCKVLSPTNIKDEVIQTLKNMKEGYIVK
ncbi:MAG: hypothetical protein NC191_05615 [Muribaculaceae bacterium]|nr:hypothetical protein [Muribaculaceae bacterium]